MFICVFADVYLHVYIQDSIIKGNTTRSYGGLGGILGIDDGCYCDSLFLLNGFIHYFDSSLNSSFTKVVPSNIKGLRHSRKFNLISLNE